MTEINPGLLTALDGIYASLRREHPDLPRALITVEEPHPAVTIRIACWRPGRFVTAAGVFEGRIAFVYPSTHRDVPRLLMNGTPASVLEVLVHESAHALATARAVKDTSRGGTWHNERYRDLATELGLNVAKDRKRGWTKTECSPALLEMYAPHLVRLADVRPADQLKGTVQPT